VRLAMNLFSRNFNIIAGSLIVFLLAMILGARVIVLDSFIQIEEKKAKEHIERVAAALRNEVSILDATCGDYATLDDTYEFVTNNNPEFIRIDLASSTLQKVRIDFVSFVTLDGKEIFSKTIDSKKGSFSPYTDLKPYLTDGISMVNLEGGVKGLIISGNNQIIISFRPVLTSEGKGPVSGILIMGRMLDAEEIQHLTELVRLPLEITPFKDRANKKAPSAVIGIQRPDLDTLNISYLFNDITAKPAFTISAKINRDIYREGAKTVKHFMYVTFAGILIALFAISRLTGRITESEWNRLITDTLYDAVIEKSSAAALIMDAETCRIIRTTPDMSKLIGYPPEQLQGVLFRELLHDSIEQFERCRSAAFENGMSPASASLNLMRSDNSIISATVETTCKIRGGKRLLLLYLQNT
jgi:sensor domain CHASE-containing protein